MSRPIRLIVCGASGKMGSRILEIAGQDPHFKITGAIEHPGHPSLGKKVLNGKTAITSNLDSLTADSDVLIDFTTPKATMEHLKVAGRRKGFSFVIGTTGLSKEQNTKLKSVAKKNAVVFSPNMSRGVNLMFELVRAAAKKLKDYDIEIIESHHNQKKDSPSGTALTMADEIMKEFKNRGRQDLVHGRKGIVGSRTKKEIGIHAIRAGDIVGDHTAVFATGGERLEVTHKASSRDAFVRGALAAAKWIAGKSRGLYSMKDVLS